MFSLGVKSFFHPLKSCGCATISKVEFNRVLTNFTLLHTSGFIQKDLQLKSHGQSSKIDSNKQLKVGSRSDPKKEHQYVWHEDSVLLSNIYKRRKKFDDKWNSLLEKNSFAAWVDRAPESVKPYLQLVRADKPIGTLLLYFPCAFSICFATPAGQLPSLYYLGLFGVGAFLMRGAGCIINDLWDRDFDKQVERTKDRPLASGVISPENAVKLLAVKLTLSLGILLSLNSTCILIGIASMVPVIMYPLAKRYTFFPQLVLGLTFNIGAIMGYTAVTGSIDWALLGPLYGSCICWTMFYDTVYAFQDVEDDERIGVKSTARLFKRRDDYLELSIRERMESENERRTKIMGFLCVALGSHMALMGLSGWSIKLEGPFTLGIMICLFKSVFELLHFNSASRDSCAKVFSNTRWHGLFILLGIIGALYLQQTSNLSLQRSRDDQQELLLEHKNHKEEQK